MMCSTWKISVFGIIALMLAFGLTAGDAFAHSDGHSDHPNNVVQHFTDATLAVTAISSVNIPGVPRDANGNGDGRMVREEGAFNLLTTPVENRLRATEVLDALVFTYKVGRTPEKSKAITITIPSGWTPATKDVDDGVHRDGEVELFVDGLLTRDKLIVTSRSMKFTGADLEPGDKVEFWYKRVTVPVRADSYEFGVISEMTGPKHVNKLNPHLMAHAIEQLDPATADPNAHDGGKVGTITLEVTDHEHPDDATHQHIDDNGLLDPPDPHSSHSTDHTHDTETKTVFTVEGHTHPFNDGFQPHQHDADNGTVYTSKTGEPDLHTHTIGRLAPFKDTHAHDEDGSVAPYKHANETGDDQHTHDDTDKSVADVDSHKHPADSILDHAHAVEGRRGIDVLDTNNDAANVHTHLGGKVDRKAHTHSGHKGDHGHTTDEPTASLPADTRHNADTHYHVSAGGEVAGVSGHKHPEDSDGGFVGHAHDTTTEADIIPLAQNFHNAGANLHMHVSDGGVITSVGKGHTHSIADNRRGHTRTHQHSTADGNEPGASPAAPVQRLTDDDAHTVTAGGHTAFYFRSGGGAPPSVDNPEGGPAVHTHSRGAVTWPEAGDAGWENIESSRFGDYGIPYHTHGSRGKVVVVTAHVHGANVDGTADDEAITVSITDHKHQTGRDVTRAGDPLEHDEEAANDLVVVAEHTQGTGTTVTIDVLAHKHQTGADATANGSFTDPAGTPVNDLVAIASQHTHSEGKTVIVVTAHTHDKKADPDTESTNTHDGELGPISTVTAHYHGASEVVEPLVSAHSHVGLLHDTPVREFGQHTHDTAVSAHKHGDEAEFSVTAVNAHTHTSSRGSVLDVSNHTHPGGDTSTRVSVHAVDPTEKHLHAILHNNKYAVRVGPVPSGSGTLALSNTGSAVRIAARTADPYKGNYVVTKGQDLGDLMLTFTASGTMVAGAGIRITLPDPNPAFPSFYRDSNAPGPPGGGGVRLTRGQVTFSADPVNDDPDGISSDALYLKTTSKLQAGDRFSVRIRDVVTNPHGADPEANEDSTDVVENYAFAASTASPLVPPTKDNPIVAADFDENAAVKAPPIVTITGQHGVGELTLEARDPRDALAQATTGEDLGDVVLTYKAVQPMGKKSQVEITIHSAWPNHPYPPADSSDERPGGVSLELDAGNVATLVINGRVLTATLDDGMAVGDTLSFTYKKAKAPAQEGQYEFTAKSKAGPHGTLKPLAADAQKKVDVTTGHGSGTISLQSGGTIFRETQKAEPLGTLVFTYTAAGRMAKEALVRVTIPQEWTPPSYDNGDSRAAGVVKLGGTGKADLEITGGGSSPWHLIAKLSEPITKNQTLVFTYRNVTAPAAAGSYAFTTSATAFPGALDIDDPGAELQSGSPEVGVDQAPDGSGTITVASTTATLGQDTTGAYLVNAGQPLGDLGFTFTATGKMESGALVSITVPSEGGWDQPTYSNTEVSAGVTLGIVDYKVTATLQSALENGDTFTITYKGITAPSGEGRSVFTAQSQSTSAGELKDLTVGSPTFVVGDVPVGSLVITTADGELKAAGPGMSLGDVTLSFTATASMSAGATVMITVPARWSIPSEDNNDGVDGAGEVELSSVPANVADLTVTGGGGQPWQLVATTSAALASGDTLVFTYKMVTTPSTQGPYDFTTSASVSATSDAVPIVQQPTTVIVRATVTAIAIAADDSFFAGESLSGMVTLWSGTSAANALGAMVVTLSSDSETGSFAADSITIADNMLGAAFTYNDTAPGMVTLTATSGTLTATADVAVKSGVAGLSVTPDLVKAGSDVTVTATGKAGGGTVKVVDSESMQIGVTKSLDPVLEPEDGDVTYSRTITLAADLADGTYTVTVDIQGLMDSMDIEVLNNQAPPTLSDATARPMTVVNGDIVTLVVKATSTIAGDISVMADVGMVDSTKTAAIPLTELTGATGTYTTIFTISDSEMNTAEDGEATITITATDRILNSSMTTVMVTLENDPSELHSAEVTPASAKPGQTIWINATGSAGGSPEATVNNSESGMMIAQVTLVEDAATAGSYSAGLTIVEDAHAVGVYDVTVTLGTKSMMLEGALTIEAAGYEFTLNIAAGTHMIHVPLDVAEVNGADMSIDTVGDLYDALGDAVNFIISLGADGNWNSYLGDSSAGTAADAAIGDDTGLIAVMSSAASLHLKGEALGTGGVATITVSAGNNLVGLPLDSAQISTISGVVASPLVSAVVVSNMAGDGFNTIAQAGDPGDGVPMGGQGYIIVAAAAASIPVIGAPWQDSAMMADIMMADIMNGGMDANGNGASAAPSIGFRTPVLQVQGKLIDEVGMMSREGLNVTVKNMSSGVVLGRSTATDTYSMTFVKLDDSAAKIGDVLEIRADSPSTLVGIRPVQHVVTSEDVLSSRISLADLVTYEIPAQTELLANYPNPFNPETWIPYRLAEDASVSVTIYGASGSLVRTIDVGFTPAAVYEGRSDAIYWDGRNNFGEQVSSGIYFYHLNAGDFSATRKMVIVK